MLDISTKTTTLEKQTKTRLKLCKRKTIPNASKETDSDGQTNISETIDSTDDEAVLHKVHSKKNNKLNKPKRSIKGNNLIGKSVRKAVVSDNIKCTILPNRFELGRITSFDEETQLYHVVYEGNDTEDIGFEVITTYMELYKLVPPPAVVDRRTLKAVKEVCQCGCHKEDLMYNFLPCEKIKNCYKLIHQDCKKIHKVCKDCPPWEGY